MRRQLMHGGAGVCPETRYSEPEAHEIRLKGAPAIPVSRARRVILAPGFKEISPFHQGAQLPIGHTARLHPQTAVGMNVSQPSLAQGFRNFFDPAGDEIGAFDFVVLDVDNSDPEGNCRIQGAEIDQFPAAPAREFKHHVIRSSEFRKGSNSFQKPFWTGCPA